MSGVELITHESQKSKARTPVYTDILDFIREGAVKPIPEKLNRVIEIACGDGQVLTLLLKKSPKMLIGVDIKDDGFRHKNGATKYGFAKGNIGWLPIKSGIFDVSVCLNASNTFTKREIENGICEMHRILRKDGTFIMSVKNAFNPLLFLRVSFRKIYYNIQCPTFFTLKYIIGLIQKAGGEPGRIEPISPYPLHHPDNLLWRAIRRSFAVLWWHLISKRFTFSPIYCVTSRKF